MEFVDDDDIEVIGGDRAQLTATQRLDGREDVLPSARAMAREPQLTECPVPQDVPEDRLALLKDLPSVGDEQQPCPGHLLTEPLVVQAGHDRLARARCRHHQIVGPAPRTLHLELLEDLPLEGIGLDLERRDVDGRVIDPLHGAAESVCIEDFELRIRPVGGKRRIELGHQCRIRPLRRPHVPLQPGYLRRMGQIRGTDVHSGVPIVPVKQPRLGMKSRPGCVVGDPHLRPKVP